MGMLQSQIMNNIQHLLVMEDARLDGNTSALAGLGRKLAAQLGVTEAGGDEYGLWCRFEVTGDDGTVASARMRWLWPGRFLMGSPQHEVGRLDDEGPVHQVVLTRGLWLGETVVTQALYQAVTGTNPSRFVSADRPVEQVSWDDCQRFCGVLGERFPLLRLRLPSEAEWEYAARAGTTTATYAGDLDIVGRYNVPVLDAIAWYGGNSGVDFELDHGHDSSGWPEKQYEHTRAGTHPVGQKQPNAWGLYDMLGNISEWCEDHCMSLSAKYESDRQYDPLTTIGPRRVTRGGSWSGDARSVRAAYRGAYDPGLAADYLGFRLAGGQTIF